MFVKVTKVVLQIPGAASLKARRQVVRSFKDRVRARYPVSVAEVGDVERYQVAELAFAMVSGAAARCDEVMDQVVALANRLPDAVLAEVRTETIAFGSGGSSLPLRLEPLPEGDVSREDEGMSDLPWAGSTKEPDRE